MKRELFGLLDGRPVNKYYLENDHLAISVLELGAILNQLIVTDPERGPRDVILGYDSLEPYVNDPHFHGAVVGRYCNRIGNSRFDLDGTTYYLPANNGANHLHGGPHGLARKIWAVDEAESNDTQLVISTFSEDGEEGYPGNLEVTITYRLEGASLILQYEAKSDADTVINLTNHAYFNLDGSSDIRNHQLVLNANHYTPTDEGQIPNGRIEPVLDTPLDFTRLKELGKDLDSDFEPIQIGSGFDHNYVLNENGTGMREVGKLSVPSGLSLKISTTQPAVQLYSGNHLGNETGKNGFKHRRNAGVCLETQHYPDAPNNPAFPSTVLKEGEVFTSMTTYEFEI